MRLAKKHRVLFVGSFPPPVHGSAVVSQQIRDSKIINDTFECDWVNLSTSRSMDEIGKLNPVKIWRLFSSLCKEFWLLMIHKYDLCYLAITCHGSGFLKDAPFVLLCKLFRKKIVIHQHNKGMTNDINKWPYRWLLPFCYKDAKVILLSWFLYPDIEKVVNKKDVLICPNGIKINEKLNEIVTKARNGELENRVPRLLFLSNLIESKGVIVLLDALKFLKEKGYVFVCDFVGGETTEIDEKRLHGEIEKRELEDFAVYCGKKFGNDKESILNRADIFVFPTYYDNECFPLVLLEAMEYGLPCVTTCEGGIRDIVIDEKTGYICPQRDFIAFANAIEKLIVNPGLRRRMGEAGRKKMLEEFDEKVFEKRIEGILKKCLACL